MAEADRQAVIDYLTTVQFDRTHLDAWNSQIWPAVEAARVDVVTGLLADGTVRPDELSEGWLDVAVMPIHDANAPDGVAMYSGRRSEIGTLPTAALVPIGIFRRMCIEMVLALDATDINPPPGASTPEFALGVMNAMAIPIITYIHTEPALGNLPPGKRVEIQNAITQTAQATVMGATG